MNNESSPLYWFIFHENELLINTEEDIIKIPYRNAIDIPQSEILFEFSPGIIGKSFYKAIALKSKLEVEGMRYHHLRTLLGRLDDNLFQAAGRSYHILNWSNNHKFCGRCGSPIIIKSDEVAKYCPSCSLVVYPRISPAVIVAVTRDDKLLLAHSGRFNNKMYSVLAGFVEPGETFEQCIVREICEEVNITVHNIKYFGSQPWPFPDSIMVAFTAEYKSGEIKPDGKEILNAGWFSRDEMPEMPGKWSIARKLIDAFIESPNRK